MIGAPGAGLAGGLVVVALAQLSAAIMVGTHGEAWVGDQRIVRAELTTVIRAAEPAKIR
jgi:hypothetical protein